jgi:hypothetical protein
MRVRYSGWRSSQRMGVQTAWSLSDGGQVEQFYHAALERERDQRGAYLKESCGVDEMLRHEVEELLAFEEQAGSFIETPALEISARQESMKVDPPLRPVGQFRLAAGDRLGPYAIIKRLGTGGMGEIYCARDSRLGRTVALKILGDRMMDQAGIRSRLDREAQAISSLNHPHICTLHDIGQEGEIDYLVMEYLEGQTLAERLREGPLPLGELLRIAIEVAEALNYAHHKGVIHMHLKPDNIMLTARGAKLLDFGLARWQQEAGEFTSVVPLDAASSLTIKGVVLGTPQYMAPEQIQRREVDGRADIFALGAVMFEMASQRKAFERQTPGEVIRSILSETPPDLSSLVTEAPAGLGQVVRRCLAKTPAERWQSAGELVRELTRIEGGSGPRKTVRLGGKLRVCVAATAALVTVAASVGDRATAVTIQFRHDVRPETLYSIPRPPAGDPNALTEQTRVIAGANGALYVINRFGGVFGQGVVMELTPPTASGGSWTGAVLYTFNGENGSEPAGSVVIGEGGALYGVTHAGGAWDHGTVFELARPVAQGGRGGKLSCTTSHPKRATERAPAVAS